MTLCWADLLTHPAHCAPPPMPFNKLHVPQSLPVAMCHAINDQLHDCLVETCNVNPNDCFCLVSRYAPSDMVFHPTFLGERDPAATIVIEIALLRGRSDAQKEALFADMRRRLGNVGFEPANSIMFLLENNAIDWSFSPSGSVKSVLGL
jgi:Tautomerase enzyme